MKNEKTKAAMNRRRKLLMGIGSVSALGAWHKPVINSIITPAHAQTSGPVVPIPAEDLCPMIVTGNNTFGPLSGSNTPPICSLTFDVLSSSATATLTIVSITNNTLPANNTVSYDTFGEATNVTGPRVVWQGPATDAPFCSDLMPIDQNDIVFTVTATCTAAAGREFTSSFTLADVLV